MKKKLPPFEIENEFQYIPEIPPRIMDLIKKTKKHWDEFQMPHIPYDPKQTADERRENFNKIERETHNNCKNPPLSDEEFEELLQFRKNLGNFRHQYLEYNANVEKLGRPTVIGVMGIVPIVGWNKTGEPNHWNNDTLKWETREYKLAEYGYEICLMSDGNIWWYFGTQKRESEKNPPKYLVEAKEIVRKYVSEHPRS